MRAVFKKKSNDKNNSYNNNSNNNPFQRVGIAYCGNSILYIHILQRCADEKMYSSDNPVVKITRWRHTSFFPILTFRFWAHWAQRLNHNGLYIIIIYLYNRIGLHRPFVFHEIFLSFLPFSNKLHLVCTEYRNIYLTSFFILTMKN